MHESKNAILTFIFREWLLLISLFGLIGTSFYLGKLPHYSLEGVAPIFLFFALFVAAKGIEQSFFFQCLARHMEGGRFLAPKFVLLTFLISLVVSIDVSLVVMLPILFAMHIRNKVNLAVIVAMTAHLGAALTPFGTPQNLFIFSFYHLNVAEFIRVIAPFSMGLLLLFFSASFFIRVEYTAPESCEVPKVNWMMTAVYLLLFGSVVLTVFRIVPIYIATLPPLFALLFDRRSLRVDYLLLLTFLIFLGLAENVREIIDVWVNHPGHIFLLTAGLSQIISNVPATLLLEKFTGEWKALLWGSNVGSFGTPIAAMANLIAYRLYLSSESAAQSGSYLLRFSGFSLMVLFAGSGLYIGYLKGWFW